MPQSVSAVWTACALVLCACQGSWTHAGQSRPSRVSGFGCSLHGSPQKPGADGRFDPGQDQESAGGAAGEGRRDGRRGTVDKKTRNLQNRRAGRKRRKPSWKRSIQLGLLCYPDPVDIHRLNIAEFNTVRVIHISAQVSSWEGNIFETKDKWQIQTGGLIPGDRV